MMVINKVIGKLPRPKQGVVLPYHKYTGRHNPLDEQLDENDQTTHQCVTRNYRQI